MSNTPKHLQISRPSPWVERWANLVPKDATVLDLAAGGGRHGRMFLEQGCRVTFVDKCTDSLADLRNHNKATVISADLEDGHPWPLEGQAFEAVIVVNYLYRPLFAKILESLKPGGVLIYETFAEGNEVYRRPRNPDHLLKNGELLDRTKNHLQTVAYEHGLVTPADIPGVKQRLCAIKGDVPQAI